MNEPFKTSLGTLCGPLILNMMLALVNLRATNAFKGTINVNFLGSGPWLEIKSERYWRFKWPQKDLYGIYIGTLSFR